MDTIWIFGDQLNRRIATLADARPGATRVLMIESRTKFRSRSWHRQHLHLFVGSMRRFAIELERAGLDLDYR